MLGAFKNPKSQAYDPIAYNHIMEIANFTNDIRFVEGKSNVVADMLSRPPDVPLGKAYELPEADINDDVPVAAVAAEDLLSALLYA